jgi:transcriptional regulator with GAF, ATPase, and Fis domain
MQLGTGLQRDTGATSSPEDTCFGELTLPRGVVRELKLAATAPATLLLTGETGVGKTAVAQAIHSSSARRIAPFVRVDCCALSPGLIESELYGHTRGAFTGAEQSRAGRFETAGRGTIFLDEIGDLEIESQRKLLRVLDEYVFERVGSSEPVEMRARVVAGTNRPLPLDVASGRFRRDLFHRISAVHIELPALRHHLENLGMLARLGLARARSRLARPTPPASDEFLARLAAYSWPGNVRELFNVLEHVVVRTSPDRVQLRASDLDGILPSFDSHHPVTESLCNTVPDIRELASSMSPAHGVESASPPGCMTLESVLRATGGNVSRAARRMGVPRSTLRYRIQRANLAHLVPHD